MSKITSLCLGRRPGESILFIEPGKPERIFHVLEWNGKSKTCFAVMQDDEIPAREYTFEKFGKRNHEVAEDISIKALKFRGSLTRFIIRVPEHVRVLRAELCDRIDLDI